MGREFTTFTSSEVEAIARVSGDQQRNFRRSGYIRKGKGGWTKFELRDVAELVIIGFHLDRKTPPSVASKLARECAPMVCAWALQDKRAIQGGDKALRDELQKKFAPDGLRRYAVVTGLSQIAYAKNVGEILAALAGNGDAIVLDLMFYGRIISDGAKRALVNVTVADEDEAA
jgi:hypothetical protein